jgi:hypothetical protein
MDGLALLRRAQDAGLRLQAAGTALKITGPKQAEPLVRLLAEHKAQVLEALRLATGELQKMQEVQKAPGSPQACLPSGEEEARREEEHAVPVEFDTGVPRAKHYERVFAALRSQCPQLIEPDRWQQAIHDAGILFERWGEQAQALGWTARELFGLHAVPERPAATYRRLSRYDETGLIWLLQGRPVVALTDTEAVILARSGARLTYRKHDKPALGPLGDSLDDFEARPPELTP